MELCKPHEMALHLVKKGHDVGYADVNFHYVVHNWPRTAGFDPVGKFDDNRVVLNHLHALESMEFLSKTATTGWVLTPKGRELITSQGAV